ncbi:MAG TPA: HAD-IIB family hydrolase [Isosphaeraceae bacterium]|nr:HAD-IIB family hydrolase [Isosphaeraceae bacterium]
MRYLALATDYDGTLAHHGQVDEPTLAALGKLRESGRKLILVTGRELEELLGVFPRIDLFDRVVAENGALLYRPETREEKRLAESPPEAFVAELRRRGVGPISVGRSIVATWEPHQNTVLDVIREFELEWHVIFNKGAVMILPSGVNKATGLAAALEELGLSPHNTVGVGDAENDHAFLRSCECSVAVANALPTVKDRADIVTRAPHSLGVVELIEQLVADDLHGHGPALGRHAVLFGKRDDGTEERIGPYGLNVLIAGTSGGGKSRIATGFLERLAEPGYQFVIIDPEGDYSSFEGIVVLGDPHRAPTVEEAIDILSLPRQNAAINLLGLTLEHRPALFATLLSRLQELRLRTGRPHWIVVDEAHHLLPTTWDPGTLTLPQELQGMLLVTVHPESVSTAVLKSVDVLFAIGERVDQTIASLARAAGQDPPAVAPTSLKKGETLAWWRRTDKPPYRVRSAPSRAEHSRHSRKYAEGSLGPERSFCFRGPEGKLNLRAQNLMVFLQMAEGVDDETWVHHLRRGDYSTWFREGIKDDELGADAEMIEKKTADAEPKESRAAIREAIETRYTLPSEAAASGLIEK